MLKKMLKLLFIKKLICYFVPTNRNKFIDILSNKLSGLNLPQSVKA